MTINWQSCLCRLFRGFFWTTFWFFKTHVLSSDFGPSNLLQRIKMEEDSNAKTVIKNLSQRNTLCVVWEHFAFHQQDIEQKKNVFLFNFWQPKVTQQIYFNTWSTFMLQNMNSAWLKKKKRRETLTSSALQHMNMIT